MGFASESGYTPASIVAIMTDIMEQANTQFGTSYTYETFVGTNLYKYMYTAAQRLQANEIKTSEIFTYLQQYFDVINARIQRPVATPPGLIEAFEAEGYVASVKPIVEADAGKSYVCVDVEDDHARGEVTITSYANLVSGTDDAITVGATVFTAQTGAATPGTGTFQAATSNDATAQSLCDQINDHATAGALVEATVNGAVVLLRAKARGTGGNSIVLTYTDNDSNVGATVTGSGTLAGGFAAEDDADYDDLRLDIATILKNSVAHGIVHMGNEIESIVLSNGQAFDYKFTLPDRQRTYLRLTLTLSDNNQLVIDAPDTVKNNLLENIAGKYRLGRDFEPQRYFTTADAPWTSQVLLEWSDNGSDWHDEIFEAEFDDLFEIDLEDITLVEA